MKENGLLGPLILGFVIVAVAIYFAPTPEINVTTGTDGGLQNTISVSGQSSFEVDPDQAEIFIRIKTEEPTAKRAQEENARLMNTVKDALENNGIKSDEMESTLYNLWPQTKWNREKEIQEETGYIAQHILKVTTDDVTNVGKIMDVAVQNGANGLDRVNFKLSDEKKEDVNSEALAQASSNAESKAKAIAQNLGVNLGKVARVSESNVGYDYYPTPRVAYAEMDMAGGMTKSSTDISPEAVSVSASIGIAYNID